MQTKKIVRLIALFMLVANIVSAQTITAEQYIAQYKDIAIREMRRMGVPAAITLAQGLLETENGNSDLVKKSNNHFGIKCKDTWTASGVTHDDDELGECFRKYPTAEDSYRDHSNFLRSRDRYAFLFKLSPLDYKGWAYGLKKAGYATNVQYPAILIKNIEQYNLQQYSEVAADDVPKIDASKYTDDSETTTDTAPSDVASKVDIDAPQNIFLINGTKCINGQKGTSLLAIATKNNIDLGRLLIFNDMDKDGILSKDQLIFLQKKSTEGDKPFYIVQQDENIYDVAQKNGIQLNSLLVYNQLNAEAKLYPGTKLYLKQLKPVVAATKLTQTTTATSKQYHDVQPKEGLYSISKKYGVSVNQIKEWNNLDSNQLRIGQQLVIYKY